MTSSSRSGSSPHSGDGGSGAAACRFAYHCAGGEVASDLGAGPGGEEPLRSLIAALMHGRFKRKALIWAPGERIVTSKDRLAWPESCLQIKRGSVSPPAPSG